MNLRQIAGVQAHSTLGSVETGFDLRLASHLSNVGLLEEVGILRKLTNSLRY